MKIIKALQMSLFCTEYLKTSFGRDEYTPRWETATPTSPPPIYIQPQLASYYFPALAIYMDSTSAAIGSTTFPTEPALYSCDWLDKVAGIECMYQVPQRETHRLEFLFGGGGSSCRPTPAERSRSRSPCSVDRSRSSSPVAPSQQTRCLP